jgi:RNA polymerase sigma-70 factor, ECF subfamily
VFRYAYWLTRNPTVAEDLVQETFLRAWRSFDSLQSEEAAKAWLFTILRRENARMYERYRPELVDIDDVSIQEDDKNEPDQRQNLAELHKAIMQLEKEYRDPLMLQVVGGFSGKEIAEILDLNNNTVMTRLFRARSKLRAILDPEAIADESGQASQEELC